MAYSIKTPKGFVYGFNNTHMIVQVTNDVLYAKKFASQKTASNFIKKYADCGYGFSAETAEIVENK